MTVIALFAFAIGYLVMFQAPANEKPSPAQKEDERTVQAAVASRERAPRDDFNARLDSIISRDVRDAKTLAYVPPTHTGPGSPTISEDPKPTAVAPSTATTAAPVLDSVSGEPGSRSSETAASDPDAALRNVELQIAIEAHKREARSMSSELIVYNTRQREEPPALGRPSAQERPARWAGPTPVMRNATAEAAPRPAQAATSDVTDKAREAPSETSGRPTARRQHQNAANRATGPIHRLFEGSIIETVLTNRLDGTFTGPVNCMVSVDVWSHNREHLLIPKGTRVLGEAKRVSGFAQQRLAVAFHRLIMPDGYSVSLDEFVGMTQIGETGLKDKVNHHYFQIFGTSVALGAIAGFSSRGASYGLNQTASDQWRQGFSQQISSDATRILDKFLNVLPTITIREGTRVKVYLTDDVLLPAYAGHRMPSDL